MVKTNNSGNDSIGGKVGRNSDRHGDAEGSCELYSSSGVLSPVIIIATPQYQYQGIASFPNEYNK